jgi:hypothetical protein
VADESQSTPKVLVPVPPGYTELPEDERLAVASDLADRIQAALGRSGT